jgi:cysteine desulfurase
VACYSVLVSECTRTIWPMTVAMPTDNSVSDRPRDAPRPVYLDCNATTPVDARVCEEVLKWTAQEFGNAGSRTHTYGQTAKERVKRAREEVASVVDAQLDGVIFTSGATESNNLAVLGLEQYGLETGKRHVVCTQIEHKAILEPVAVLERRGFEVTRVAPNAGGWVDPAEIAKAVRPDTLLVSVMAVNNETGVIQPIEQIAELLATSEAFLHVDAAQGFGKLIAPLQNARIDMLSVSGHKVFAPKGIGALIMRRRRFKRPPLNPLIFGGGQERGLRPGTLPVALIAALGMASSLALDEHKARADACDRMRVQALTALAPLGIVMNGDPARTVAHTLNFSVPGLDSEAAIVALKDVAAISNGSACTSQSYEPSHVLVAAGLSDAQIAGALRLSWSHMTVDVNWEQIASRLARLRNVASAT